MIIIRFSRIGKKGHAQYKVVLAEKAYPVQGKFIEQLGSYDPHKKEAVLKADRIKYWIEKGAACSDSAHNLFVREGLINAEKRKVSIEVVEKEAPAEAEKAEVVAEEKKEDVALVAEMPTEEAKTEEKK
jgi:small subunit ribosomal protein S16